MCGGGVPEGHWTVRSSPSDTSWQSRSPPPCSELLRTWTPRFLLGVTAGPWWGSLPGPHPVAGTRGPVRPCCRQAGLWTLRPGVPGDEPSEQRPRHRRREAVLANWLKASLDREEENRWRGAENPKLQKAARCPPWALSPLTLQPSPGGGSRGGPGLRLAEAEGSAPLPADRRQASALHSHAAS